MNRFETRDVVYVVTSDTVIGVDPKTYDKIWSVPKKYFDEKNIGVVITEKKWQDCRKNRLYSVAN